MAGMREDEPFDMGLSLDALRLAPALPPHQY
jgi:hypothetical protein